MNAVTHSSAAPSKLDLTRCGVADLHTALERFDNQFSIIWQDVNDLVSFSESELSVTPVATNVANTKVDATNGFSQIPLEVEKFHSILEEVSTLVIACPQDLYSLSYIIKFLNKYP